TRALPELACFDAKGRELPARSALENAAPTFSTNWQEYHRTLVARPVTAFVRPRLRGDGHGFVESGRLSIQRATVNTYQTGVLVEPLDATLRKGLVLESNFGIVNRERVVEEDVDGDGRWARVSVDLDKITQPGERGEDWRSRFEVNPNAIFWSDGSV